MGWYLYYVNKDPSKTTVRMMKRYKTWGGDRFADGEGEGKGRRESGPDRDRDELGAGGRRLR